MPNLDRRLAALEARYQPRDGGSPERIYAFAQHHGIDTPKPVDGEDVRQWLKRVPSSSLDSILKCSEETT